MIQALRTLIARKRFERAFAAELERVAEERRRHAQVRHAEAELQARVHDALRGGRA